MKTMWKCEMVVAVVVLAVLPYVPHAVAGRPLPYEYPEHFRQANMVMLKFQEALAAKRWEEALSYCSDRVRDSAKRWATCREFFAATTPLERILKDYRFGFWQERHKKDSHYYGLAIPLTPGKRPYVHWYWSISTAKNTWVLDWEPVAMDLETLIQEKKSRLAERERQIVAARRVLEPKLRAVKTHLSAGSETFVIGSPMLFRVELMNFGESPIQFVAAGVGYHPLRVFNQNKQSIPCIKEPAQIGAQERELAPHESVVLADRIDINQDYRFTKPGTYFVQFDGESLEIGERIPSTDTRFGDEDEFIATRTKFPSNVVQIEITNSD